jgi:hypothetical protein
MIKPCHWFLIMAVLAGGAAVTTDPIVTLADGTILRGGMATSGTVNTFLGIPYAIPPINERRWTPPEAWVNSDVTNGID